MSKFDNIRKQAQEWADPPQTSPTAKHSPTPWQPEQYQVDDNVTLVRSVNGWHVCYCDRPTMDAKEQNKANAELICRAVNNYESLLSALEQVQRECNLDQWPEACKAVHDALTAATSQRKVE